MWTKKLTIFTGTAWCGPPENRTRCGGCNSSYFICDEERNFSCENCGSPFHVETPEYIERMYKLTVYLNEDEPIIGPVIYERIKRDRRLALED